MSLIEQSKYTFVNGFQIIKVFVILSKTTWVLTEAIQIKKVNEYWKDKYFFESVNEKIDFNIMTSSACLLQGNHYIRTNLILNQTTPKDFS